MVPQLATAAAQGGCLSMGTRKDKADRWERPASLNQSAWDFSRSLGCVWEGASTNGLGTVADLGCGSFIACATCSRTCNVAYLPRPQSPFSERFLVLLFGNEYLENADQAHGLGDDAPEVAPSKRHSGPVGRHHMLPKVTVTNAFRP
jgi:hypothetical protein